MQVLVALFKARGAIVTRDDLIASCWSGRIVGDNAIQRTISRIRDLAAANEPAGFRLETIPKVGYRLIEIATHPEHTPSLEIAQTGAAHGRTRLFLAIAAFVLALSIGGGVWLLQSPVETFGVTAIAAPGPENREMMGAIANELAQLSNTSGIPIPFYFDTRSKASRLILQGAQQRSGDALHAAVSLYDSRTSELMWSASAERPAGQSSELYRVLSRAVMEALTCVVPRGSDPPMDNAGMRAALNACGRILQEPDPQLVQVLRQAAQSNPGSAALLAYLSQVEAQLGQVEDGNEPTSAQLQYRAAAHEHLARAREIDPSNGEVYVTEYFLTPSNAWPEQFAALSRGLAVDQANAHIYMLRTQVLQKVGFMEEAVESARRGTMLNPSSPDIRATYISALAYNGYADTAHEELVQAIALWPLSPALQEAQFRFALRYGDARTLLKQIESGTSFINSSAEFQMGPTRGFLIARISPTPENIETAVQQSLSIYHRFGAPQFAVQTLGRFDRIDDAFRVLNDPPAIASLKKSGTDILFRPGMRAIRLDPRFALVAKRLGLAQFWRRDGQWPDFCADSQLTYDCRIAMNR